jgi:SAM-dependent methyltransferase
MVPDRWPEFLASLMDLLPADTATVLIDGPGEHQVLADRLAATLRAAGRSCLLGHGPAARTARDWDVVIWVRSERGHHGPQGPGEETATIVTDLHDPAWPVIRNVAGPLTGRGHWYVTETRAFFAPRAATWDAKFGDDLPAYAAAIAEARIAPGSVALDIGCGTGRALPVLRDVVGPLGTVVAADLTPEMLHHARAVGRADHAGLVLADARRLPFATAAADAIFAAGLISHLPDPEAGLRELARVTRPGGTLALFHPTGRAALAARHGRTLDPDEPLAAGPLQQLTSAAGWDLTSYDDAEHRFLAIATRR